ncbi:MAG: N-acyl homoserine lactone hydrolase [Nocardioidaceae bacterium]|jgi:N-acyl homoserine lactone hydrolase|nr:N-acyl homoserine lactone hydrolase [Nocardioidaceae bacterium]
MGAIEVRQVDFGYFVRPAAETGMDVPRVEPCLGYLVTHPAGVLLFDTGMGGSREIDDHYRPRRRGVAEALAAVGSRVDAVTLVANCHLHFDHCGGNPMLAGLPVFTQTVELADARGTEDYTLPELIEAPGIRYEELSGETEVLPGLTLMPTPGHTAGHQSLVVRRGDGTVIVAGQSHPGASAYSAEVLAWRVHRAGDRRPLPVPPEWVDRLMRLDPARVVFAHDHAVWEP